MIQVKDVAEKMKITPLTLRMAMQIGQCPFGRAIKAEQNKRFTYVFFEPLVRLYVGEVAGMTPETDEEKAARLEIAVKLLENPKASVEAVVMPCMRSQTIAEKAAETTQNVSEVFIPARSRA